MKVESACRKDERRIYWSCTVGRCHNPSHNCIWRCVSLATKNAIQLLLMFWPHLGVQPFCDHVTFVPRPVVEPNHQGHNSYPYRTRYSSHWPVLTFNCRENQREDQLERTPSRNCWPVLNLELIPGGWCQGGSKIDHLVTMSCFHCCDPCQGSGPVIRTAHQIGPSLIPLGGSVWCQILRGKETSELVFCSAFEHSGSR